MIHDLIMIHVSKVTMTYMKGYQILCFFFSYAVLGSLGLAGHPVLEDGIANRKIIRLF